MAKIRETQKKGLGAQKKTRQGNSIRTKCGSKGGGQNGSTTSKTYKKLKRGQGR